MSIEHSKPIGLVQYLLFPLLGVFLELEGYLVGRPVPVSAFAGLYPISLVLLSLYPPLIPRGSFFNPALDVVRFARGAFLAAVGIFVLVTVLFGAAFAYDQTAIALGVLFVGVGSLWLPTASAAAGYGKMLAESEKGAKDFLEQLKQHHLFEVVATAYLGLYLRKRQLLLCDNRATLALLLSLLLYPVGWAVLGIAGGYPLILFGILMLPIYLIVVGLELRAWVPIEKRQHVSDLITSST